MSASDKIRLRNKKTGKIKEFDALGGFMLSDDYPSLYTEDKTYNSLAELNEDWEDTPAEPLIKDEKARKVFREWAEFFGAERFRVTHLYNSGEGKTTSIGSTDVTTEPLIELPGHIGEDSEIYAKVELVGEEGE